jgi:riboflavin biosynthesis pyrimidine reductase
MHRHIMTAGVMTVIPDDPCLTCRTHRA